MSVIVAMVLAALSLVPWLGALFISFFLFDAPDAADKPLLGAAALAIWSYPLFVLVGIACGFSLRKTAPGRALLLSLGVPGAAALVAAVLVLIALD